MSTNINRYKPDNDGRLWPTSDGEYVLYADHIAALALLPGEQIGWQLVPKELTTEMREALMMIRQELGSTLMDNADEIYSAFLSWAPKFPASPAPLPVAVKIKPLEWREESIPPAGEILAPSPIGLYCVKLGAQNFYPLWLRDKVQLGYFTTIEEAKAAAQADYESRIRSALSFPVGWTEGSQTEKLGRFGHHPDPAIDFCVEVEAIEGEFFNLSVGFENGTPSHEELTARVEKAMSFRVGGDENAVLAKATLRGIDAKLRSSPTPASDIAALREELSAAASLLETLSEELPDDDVSGIMMKVMAERNRSALQHVAKGER